jgi:hypothetical protein
MKMLVTILWSIQGLHLDYGKRRRELIEDQDDNNNNDNDNNNGDGSTYDNLDLQCIASRKELGDCNSANISNMIKIIDQHHSASREPNL